MWKEDGDLEMVGSQDGNSFDFDDQGYNMGSEGRKTTRGPNNQRGKWMCCLGMVVVTMVAVCAMAYAFVPQFGLVPQWLSGNNSNNDFGDDDAYTEPTGTVSEDSIVDHSAYDIILQVPIETVEADVVVYEHRKTKTPVMTILPYDTTQDSVFGISFRTKPENSHGAAHVLEHSVLAGSKKYPIKDPFTQVLKGSLNTYVNALTMGDLTAYICASRNDVDMKNLMSVYMDAVFQPLVVEDEGSWILRQEGWRVEMNETGEPEFNGVVLSEMKGGMSNPDEIAAEYMEGKLFPDTTYRFNSGGDPVEIPQLTQAELTQFYKTYYHPSNAQAFLYGTIESVKNCLTQMDEYLRTYRHNPDVRNESKIELQPLLEISIARHRIPFEAETEDEPHQLLMSWLVSARGTMDDAFQRKNRMAYAVLDELLNNDKSGVLYLALQNSGLGGSIEGDIDMSQLQWTFDLQVSNIAANDTDAVEDIVRDTMQDVVKNGFHQEDILSAVNTVEFNNRDISSANTPRGIFLWMKVMETYKFDLDPLTGFLSSERDLHELKQSIKKHGSRVFQDIIQNNIIDNPHGLVAELYPDPTLAQTNSEDEQKRLVKLRKSREFEALLDEADALAEVQVKEETPELLATIPSVTVADLEKKEYEPPILVSEDREGTGVTVVLHEVPSSFGIIYVDFGVDISALDFDDIILLPLFARLIVDGGTHDYDDMKIAREIGKNTGGIDSEILVHPILSPNATTQYEIPSGDNFNAKLFLHGSASKDKSESLLALLSQIMFEALLDNQDRALGILRDIIANLDRKLAAGGTQYSDSRIYARYTPPNFIEELYGGVTSIPKFHSILETAENDWSTLLARLQKMKDTIIKSDRKGMILNLTGEKSVLKHCGPVASHFLAKQLPERSSGSPLPDFATERHPWLEQAKKLMAETSPIRNEGIVSSAQVNFVGAGGPFYNPGEAISGGTAVVTQFVEFNDFMLQIRERRGAYGAFASLDKWTGLLVFMSYRDPNLGETLQVYESVPSYLIEVMQNAATAIPLINSAIIGTIGSLDGPAPQPNTAGWISLLRWLSGSTPKMRQQFRDDILATSNNDFLEYAKRFDSWNPTLAITGPKALLKKEKSLNLTLIDEV